MIKCIYINYTIIILVQVRSPENKMLLAERKKIIQNKFRSEMGLLVDVVLQGISLIMFELLKLNKFWIE